MHLSLICLVHHPPYMCTIILKQKSINDVNHFFFMHLSFIFTYIKYHYIHYAIMVPIYENSPVKDNTILLLLLCVYYMCDLMLIFFFYFVFCLFLCLIIYIFHTSHKEKYSDVVVLTITTLNYLHPIIPFGTSLL